MIDPKMLKSLIRMMVENEITEMDLKDGEEQISLKRGKGGAIEGAPVQQVIGYPQAPAAPAPMSPMQAAPAPAPTGDTAAPAADEDAGLVPLMSPMVGTFYSAANPDSEAFVKPGTSISADSVVCIVEAMKVFNEIKAEMSGTVEKVLVENGQAVDCDTKLFLVRP